MSVILYAMLLGHLVAYKEQYTNIGIMFAVTVVTRILVKKTGDKDSADLITVGGTALTIEQVIVLLKKVTTSSFDGKGGVDPTKGLLPSLLESVKGLIIK